MTYIKLSKSHSAKIIHWGEFFDRKSGNLKKKVLLDFDIPLLKDILPKLTTKATLSVTDKGNKKNEIDKTRTQISWCYDGTCGCFIDSTYDFFIDATCIFFINECYNWKRQEGGFLPLLALSLMMKVLWKGVRRAGRG